MKISKHLLRASVMCVALGAFVFSVAAEAAEKIRMGSRLEYYDVVYREGAFDKKYDIEAVSVPFKTGVEVVTALQSGDIDIASSGHVPLTILLSKTDKVMVIASAAYNTGSIYRMVVGKDSKYKTIEDLKGKVIATKLGSGSYGAFLRYIKSKGLSEKDFKMKNAGPGAIVAAMQAGSVDAGIWFEPTISLILYRGWGRALLDFKDHAIFQVHWLVNREFAEKNPDVIVRFLAGAMDAQKLLGTNAEKASKMISTGYQRRGRDYPAEVFKLGIPLINFDTAVDAKHLDEIKRTYNFLKERGRIRGTEPDWSRVIDLSYLEKAKKIRK